MARRRKGRALSGWLVLDKPAGITSASAVNKIRWAFDAQKAGHTGTLDPAATGLLPIALGEATKTIPYVTDANKTYRFVVHFGVATNTDDAEGIAIRTSDKRPKDKEIETALTSFQGEIQQVPPQYSAVKIDGERAYKLARAGSEVAIEARPLFVEDLHLVRRIDEDRAELELTCGKGGYVRSIARDLGDDLGCYAHVEMLRRVRTGPFDLEMAVTMDDLLKRIDAGTADDLILPLEIGLSDLAQVPCRAEAAAAMRHGNPGDVVASDVQFGDAAWASLDGRAVAIGTYRGGQLHPKRVILQ